MHVLLIIAKIIVTRNKIFCYLDSVTFHLHLIILPASNSRKTYTPGLKYV